MCEVDTVPQSGHLLPPDPAAITTRTSLSLTVFKMRISGSGASSSFALIPNCGPFGAVRSPAVTCPQSEEDPFKCSATRGGGRTSEGRVILQVIDRKGVGRKNKVASMVTDLRACPEEIIPTQSMGPLEPPESENRELLRLPLRAPGPDSGPKCSERQRLIIVDAFYTTDRATP